MIGSRRSFLAAFRALDEKIFTADFATRNFGVFMRSEVFKGSAVGARHAERIFANVNGRLVRIFQQARRLVVKCRAQFIRQKIREGAANSIYAVVGKIAVAFEKFGRRFYLAEKFRETFNLQRVVVLETVIVGAENLCLRKVEQSFNRLPLRNRCGKFFCGVAENVAQIVC